MFLACSGKVLEVFFARSSTVSPAVSRLTVYRRLQVIRGSPRRKKIVDGTIREIGVVFLKKSRFYDISNYFLDLVLLKIVNTEAHARGFAPLWPVG